MLNNCKSWAKFVNEGGESADIAAIWLEEDGRKLVAVQDAIKNLSTTVADNGITDEMIARAKSFPVDKLIDFTRGKCHAFCHEDKNPSMFHGTRLNLAVCPVCDKKFDPIAILMQRDGMSFIAAVKELQ